jgi:hypothetical protein
VPGSPVPDPSRSHDVSGLTDAELERIRRDLRASLALARPGSIACVPMLAHLSAVESELAERSADCEREAMRSRHPDIGQRTDTSIPLSEPR